MHTPSWLSSESLVSSLMITPWQWQSAQAHRLLEKTGLSITYDTDTHLDYPLGEIHHIQKDNNSWKIYSTLYALNGYNGVLPYSYQDIERKQRLVDDNYRLNDYFSIFNNKQLSYNSIIEMESHFSTQYEKYHHQNTTEKHPLQSVSGIPIPKLIPPNNLIRYASFLSQKSTSLSGLTAVLKDYFSLLFHFETPTVVKMTLSKDCLTSLQSHSTLNNKDKKHLGSTALIGKSCYLFHSSIKLVITVSDSKEYRKITKDYTLYPAIMEMCSIYFSNSTNVRLQIKCPRKCLQSPTLSSKPSTSVGRLGKLSCLAPELHPSDSIIMDYSQS